MKVDDKVVQGPRVFIEVDQHLQHEDCLCDDSDGGGVDGDGDVLGGGVVGNEHLGPVEDGRAGLNLRDWVLWVENVNDRHSAFRRRRISKNCLPEYFYTKVKWISFIYFVSYLF